MSIEETEEMNKKIMEDVRKYPLTVDECYAAPYQQSDTSEQKGAKE